MYKKLLKPGGPLATTGNISVTINTDGVDDICQSTTYSLWPVFLTINELSPFQRYLTVGEYKLNDLLIITISLFAKYSIM